jgi:hypothetical protein
MLSFFKDVCQTTIRPRFDMATSKKNHFVDAGRAETETFEPNEEVVEEFAEAQKFASGAVIIDRELREHHSRTPELSAGDIDADWQRADIGDETVGGSAPTPGQDIVENLGEAVGITYEDNEPLQPDEKVRERDRHRWELDPASSEDYNDRVNREGQ